MNKGGTFEAAGIGFTMVHADHTGGATLTAGDGQVTRDFGCWGWILEFEDGTTVYHSGDTDVFGDMSLVRQRFVPELAVLPIGGHYTMGPRDAALAVEMIGASIVIPVHYGTFPALAGTPDELREQTARDRDSAGARGDLGDGALGARPQHRLGHDVGRPAQPRRAARCRRRRGSRKRHAPEARAMTHRRPSRSADRSAATWRAGRRPGAQPPARGPAAGRCRSSSRSGRTRPPPPTDPARDRATTRRPPSASGATSSSAAAAKRPG